MLNFLILHIISEQYEVSKYDNTCITISAFNWKIFAIAKCTKYKNIYLMNSLSLHKIVLLKHKMVDICTSHIHSVYSEGKYGKWGK